MPTQPIPVPKKTDVPEGVWDRCQACGEMLYTREFEELLRVCQACDHHHRLDARTRIRQLCDEGTFEERLADLVPVDPLKFKDRIPYGERIRQTQEKTQEKEAIVVGKAYIKGRGVILGVMNPAFIMASMGAVVGEKVTASIEWAMDADMPLVLVTASGGARMQEGMVSLVQMAKTSALLGKFDEAGGLYITVLTDPTTAGVAASFAMLGDVIISEPRAMVGFAGPRVIANTIREELPEGFQTAEFLLDKGFIDRIVSRKDLRSEISRIIDFCGK